jgi:hypothetical protein
MERDKLPFRIADGLLGFVGFVWVIIGVLGVLVELLAGEFVGVAIFAVVVAAGFAIIEFGPRASRRAYEMGRSIWGKSERPVK